MARKPKLSFNEALNKEFKKFVFGFMDVVERQTVLSKKIQLIVWQHFKDFLSP
jgi:hypothetical protein